MINRIYKSKVVTETPTIKVRKIDMLTVEIVVTIVLIATIWYWILTRPGG